MQPSHVPPLQQLPQCACDRFHFTSDLLKIDKLQGEHKDRRADGYVHWAQYLKGKFTQN